MEEFKFTTSKGNFVVYECAPDATNFRISKGFPEPPKGDLVYDTKLNIYSIGDIILPHPKFTIIGTSSEIIKLEELSKMLVDEIIVCAMRRFENYLDKSWCNSATQSAITLFEANGMVVVNPYPNPGLMPSYELNQYREAQSQIKNYIILKED